LAKLSQLKPNKADNKISIKLKIFIHQKILSFNKLAGRIQLGFFERNGFLTAFKQVDVTQLDFIVIKENLMEIIVANKTGRLDLFRHWHRRLASRTFAFCAQHLYSTPYSSTLNAGAIEYHVAVRVEPHSRLGVL